MGVKSTWTGPVFAPETIANVCAQCRHNLDSVTAVVIGSQSYHPRCLICVKCHNRDASIYLDYRGKPICQRCSGTLPGWQLWQEKSRKGSAGVRVASPARRPSQPLGPPAVTKKCTACQRAIPGEFLQVPGFGTFHKSCFTCSCCLQPMSGTKLFEDAKTGKPLCVRCGR
eukprot:EG_transcript_23453